MIYYCNLILLVIHSNNNNYLRIISISNILLIIYKEKSCFLNRNSSRSLYSLDSIMISMYSSTLVSKLKAHSMIINKFKLVLLLSTFMIKLILNPHLNSHSISAIKLTPLLKISIFNLILIQVIYYSCIIRFCYVDVDVLFDKKRPQEKLLPL